MLASQVIPVIAVFISGVWAQSDMAQCGAGYDWNKNSLGQDPCTVGSMLDAGCRGLAEYTYPSLNSSQYYLPPRSNHSGDVTCDCNTVMYSLYMACSSCQGGTIYSWVQWIPQCDSVYVTEYPVDIAQGTAVPHWAYFNITTLPNQTWSDTTAMSVGRNPEQLPKQINTVSSTSSSGTLPKTSSGFALPTSNSKSGGTNVGPIVGGVVGGIAALTILGVAVFLYTRHRQQQVRQPNPMGMPGHIDDPYKRPMSYGPPPMTNVPFTPYNPYDPSTFPPQSPPSSVAYTTPPQPPRSHGAYSGMPEV